MQEKNRLIFSSLIQYVIERIGVRGVYEAVKSVRPKGTCVKECPSGIPDGIPAAACAHRLYIAAAEDAETAGFGIYGAEQG